MRLNMLKKLSCIISVILCSIICCIMITGCSDKYHAVFYNNVKIWMSYKFFKEHKIYNIYYEDGDPKEGDLVYKDGTYVDRTSPKNYTFIINEEEQFRSIFTRYGEEFAGGSKIEEIDFDKSTVVLYIFCSSNTKEYKLKNIKINEKTAEIYYKEDYHEEELNHTGYITVPYERCFMVVLDKVDITSAEFVEQK